MEARRQGASSVATAPVAMSFVEGEPKQGRLQPKVMGAPVERWACDLAGPFPTSTKGYVYILTCVCIFSKFIVLVLLRDKYATTVA